MARPPSSPLTFSTGDFRASTPCRMCGPMQPRIGTAARATVAAAARRRQHSSQGRLLHTGSLCRPAPQRRACMQAPPAQQARRLCLPPAKGVWSGQGKLLMAQQGAGTFRHLQAARGSLKAPKRQQMPSLCSCPLPKHRPWLWSKVRHLEGLFPAARAWRPGWMSCIRLPCTLKGGCPEHLTRKHLRFPSDILVPAF